MQWISQNIGIVVQAVITTIGSSIAIWIAMFQQRSIQKRELSALSRQRQALATIVMREVFELSVRVAANMAFVKSHISANPNLDEVDVLKNYQVELPIALAIDYDKSLLLGPELSVNIVRIHVALQSFNSATTVNSREEMQSNIGDKLRNLDKTIGLLLTIF